MLHEAPEGLVLCVTCPASFMPSRGTAMFCRVNHCFLSVPDKQRHYYTSAVCGRAGRPINRCLHFQSREQIKISLWNDHFVEYGRTVCMFRTEKIRKLVAMGIPESLRGRLWLLFSGRSWHSQAFCDLWNRLRSRSPVSRDTIVITMLS